MTFDDLGTFYHANQALIVSLGALAGVGTLLLMASRLRAMKEHRATLMVANILTIAAAALATMVSASGMWKFFTDILGQTPLRIAFFAFIEVALFASALLARSRLLREPEKGSTGVDGIAVWVLAALTATLSALDSDTFREVCLRLVAPLVAAWMWERALAAERNVRLGTTATRINWTITLQRIFVWLRLAEAQGRDVTEVDRARRRTRLGRARLHLYLLHSKKSFGWRLRRAHRKVIRQAMRAAEHIGLADFPQATSEREAIQMYMATLYGFVDATSPQAVAHLDAWQTASPPQHSIVVPHGTQRGITIPVVGPPGREASTVRGNGIGTPHPTTVSTVPLDVPEQCDAAEPAITGPAQVATSSVSPDAGNGQWVPHHGSPQIVHAASAGAGTAIPEFIAPQRPLHHLTDPQGLHLDIERRAAVQTGAELKQTRQSDPDDDELAIDESSHTDIGGRAAGEESDTSAVTAMRRFWEQEVTNGRVPSGAQLSRSAGVPPSTGLGRRKRREWEAELPEHLKTAMAAGR